MMMMRTDVEFRPQDSDIAGLFNPAGYGNYFHMHNEGSMAYVVTVRFGPNCGGGDGIGNPPTPTMER